MTQENHSPMIIALFLADPDRYSEILAALLKGLQAQLSTEQFKVTVKQVQDHFIDDDELGYEFFSLLFENDFWECLAGTRRLPQERAVACLERMGIKKYPTEDGMDFWNWFEALPQTTRQRVWDVVGEMPYG